MKRAVAPYIAHKRIEETMSNEKTAWITGASSGIGMEFAKRYAAMGYRLILTARRKERLEVLADSLKVPCRILPADLSVEEECFRLCEELTDENIDVFINNAGFGTCGSFLDTDLKKEVSILHVNINAMHILLKYMLRKMQKQGYGTILNVGSSAGLLPAGPFMATYYASKAYVVSLSRAIAEELRQAHSAVYVCVLCPGPVDTEFNDRANVKFALKGISAKECVQEAFCGMKRKKTIIVPTRGMRAVTAVQHLVPFPVLLPMVARQQKKKQ